MGNQRYTLSPPWAIPSLLSKVLGIKIIPNSDEVLRNWAKHSYFILRLQLLPATAFPQIYCVISDSYVLSYFMFPSYSWPPFDFSSHESSNQMGVGISPYSTLVVSHPLIYAQHYIAVLGVWVSSCYLPGGFVKWGVVTCALEPDKVVV